MASLISFIMLYVLGLLFTHYYSLNLLTFSYIIVTWVLTTTFPFTKVFILVANQYFKPIGNKSKISVLGARAHCSIRQFYNENLIKCSQSKLFLIVFSSISLFKSLHLEFYSSSYGHFTITDRIDLYPEF